MSSSSTQNIQVLSEAVIHKIAAGEVVERPASVVKELVENAIDAGATSIHIDIEEGGIRSIVVSDNGFGIPAQQLAQALKRHATSKIREAEDLFALHTLGFRGEALAAISHVSRFTIESATETTAPVAYVIDVEGGKEGALREVAMQRGTRVSVRDLFCLTPARLKFLKKPETEWGYIDDLVTALALSHLEIEWSLKHNQKKSIFCPVAKDLKSRVLDLFGTEVAASLYPIEREVDGIRLQGLIGHPNFSKKTNRDLYTFVNGRYVQDRLLNHAIVSGYRGLLMTQQYPMAILQINVDPALVDVNVHPTKREVRFSNANVIHHFISGTISAALSEAPWQQKVEASASSAANFVEEIAFKPAAMSFAPAVDSEFQQNSKVETQDYAQGVKQALQNYQVREVAATYHPEKPQAKIGVLSFADLRLIGQFHATYMVCESEGSLLLIDQHAAHERIGFEKLKAAHVSGQIPQQRLLTPLHFDLKESEAACLRASLKPLAELGFTLDEFGENSFVLKAHPVLLTDCDWLPLLKEIASQVDSETPWESAQERLDHVLATMACHRQIRAHQKLSLEEMSEMLRQLEGTPRSYHCPHGRPVMVEWNQSEIERWFKRLL